MNKIRIGISSCLLGEKVRYNGGDKYDPFINESLANYFEWVPVCPEVEIGLGVPRESVHLIKKKQSIALVSTKTEIDYTNTMTKFSEKKVQALIKNRISGYILKKSSPSCGMERVRIYGKKGVPTNTGSGLFAGILMKALPNLPVEEEGRLHDPILRENWIERVFAYRRLQDLLSSNWKLSGVIEFHTRHKLALFAHSEPHYRQLGRLVAQAKNLSRSEFEKKYESLFMQTLQITASRKKNTNVLQHMMGYFKNQLDKVSKEELLQSIQEYQKGFFPITVPLTLIQHYVRLYKVDYLAGQTYLNPHPKELALRNFIQG
jgi:uncharacterized protein YbgA (DUF1722 family)/uncharacterized protein YbbK (DUF523 family)